ncbi:MAG TPA: acyl carrier protein [Terriglobia bacterium]|nr:acyl carrier protein [Terriglobia bacterium]
MQSRDEIFQTLRGYLIEMFEVPPAKITLDARLYEDLDLDSIDAVDLIVKLQEFTRRKFKAEEFKTVRHVRDVIDRVESILAE